MEFYDLSGFLKIKKSNVIGLKIMQVKMENVKSCRVKVSLRWENENEHYYNN